MNPAIEKRERWMFLVMALLLVAVVLAGFGLFAALGMSSFEAPWWVHVHAASFLAWIVLYLTQNLLVVRNRLAAHRRLGAWGAGLAAWIVVGGLVLTPATLASGRAPLFLAPQLFLAMNWINMLAFAGLFVAGLRLRRSSDWHRRLMLCATLCVIKPACGRLLLVFAGASTPMAITIVMLAGLALAMLADWCISGRVHPAWLWGCAVIIGMGLATGLLAALPPFAALALRIAG